MLFRDFFFSSVDAPRHGPESAGFADYIDGFFFPLPLFTSKIGSVSHILRSFMNLLAPDGRIEAPRFAAESLIASSTKHGSSSRRRELTRRS